MSSPRDVLASLNGSSQSHSRALVSRGGSGGHGRSRTQSVGGGLLGGSGSPRYQHGGGHDARARRGSGFSTASTAHLFGPESGESLESLERKGARGFEPLGRDTLVSLPFFDALDAKSARKIGQFFTRRVFEEGERIVHTEPVRPAAASADGAAASAAAGSSSPPASPVAAASAAAGAAATAPVVDSKAFHILVRGRVEVSCVSDDGRVLSLGQRSHPAYISHDTLLAHDTESVGSLRPVQVRALEQCIVLSIGADKFEEFIAANPAVRVALHCNNDCAAAASSGSSIAAALSSSATPASSSSSPSSSASSSLHHRSCSAALPSLSSSSSSSSSLLGGLDQKGGGSSGKLTVSLRDVPFFRTVLASVSEQTLQHLASLFEFRRCSEGQVLLREHEPASGFFVLLSGRVSCSAMAVGSTSPSSHHSMHLSTISGGDAASWFGDLSLLFQTPRTATVTALQPCTLLFLSAEHFATFLRLAPDVLTNKIFQTVLHRRVGNSLKTVPLFQCLRTKEKGPLTQWREEVLLQLGGLFSFKFFPRGSVVCREGEEAHHFLLIHRGNVEVSARTHGTDDDDDLLDFLRAQGGGGGGGGHNQGGGASNGSSSIGGAKRAGSPVAIGGAGRVSDDGLPTDAGSGSIVLTELGPGDFLGELSMTASNSRRTATVVALTDLVVLQLHRSDFDAFVALVPDDVQLTLDRVSSMRTSATLSQIPFFKSIKENRPWSKLGLLGSMFRFEARPKGAVVVAEGEPGSTFFVVVDGVVEVSKVVQNRWTGQPEVVVLDELGRSSFFGELSLLRSTIRLATVTCRTDCLFLSVSKDQFDKFRRLAPDVADSFAAHVTSRTANQLRSVALFGSLIENKPWSKLELLCTLFTVEYFDAHVLVYAEDDESAESDKLYVLNVGAVALTRRRQPGDPPSDPLPASSSSPSPSPSSPSAATPAGGGSASATAAVASSSSAAASPNPSPNPSPKASPTMGSNAATAFRGRLPSLQLPAPPLSAATAAAVASSASASSSSSSSGASGSLNASPIGIAPPRHAHSHSHSYLSSPMLSPMLAAAAAAVPLPHSASASASPSPKYGGTPKHGGNGGGSGSGVQLPSPLPSPASGSPKLIALPSPASSSPKLGPLMLGRSASFSSLSPAAAGSGATSSFMLPSGVPLLRKPLLPSIGGISTAMNASSNHHAALSSPSATLFPSSGAVSPTAAATTAASSSISAASANAPSSSSSSGISSWSSSPANQPSLPPMRVQAESDNNPSLYRRVLDRGSYFNDVALLASLPRAATVVTLEPCVCFTLTREKFAKFAKVAPEMVEALRRAYPFANEQQAAAKARAAARTAATAAAAAPSSSSASPAEASSSSSLSSAPSSAGSPPPSHHHSHSMGHSHSSSARPQAAGGSGLLQHHSSASASSTSSLARYPRGPVAVPVPGTIAPAPLQPLRPLRSSSISGSVASTAGVSSSSSGLGVTSPAEGGSVLLDAQAVHSRDGSHHSRCNSGQTIIHSSSSASSSADLTDFATTAANLAAAATPKAVLAAALPSVAAATSVLPPP